MRFTGRSLSCFCSFSGPSLAVVAFALVYQGSGSRFQEDESPVSFGTLLYMSGSTFLTLGLGDVTSPDSLGRAIMVFEAATGFVFLGLIITYMPLLDQAYAGREVGALLLQSRAGKPPSAVRLLRRYAGGPDRAEILRANLREGEHWLADIMQSHLSHPVLCFYRAQHYGQSWLVSLTTLMDTCALLVVGGEGLVREQARLTYRMGLLLLGDLTSALGMSVPARVETRLTAADLPALRTALSTAGIALKLGPDESHELLRINQRYDGYLHVMSRWLLITLPPWIPPAEEETPKIGLENTQAVQAISSPPRKPENRSERGRKPAERGSHCHADQLHELRRLTAMITPAIFMTANASLIISTSNRVSRVVDRIRVLNDLADKLDRGVTQLDFTAERLEHQHDQMRRLECRSDRLRFALTALYLAFTSFVGTSLTLAIDAMVRQLADCSAHPAGGRRGRPAPLRERQPGNGGTRGAAEQPARDGILSRAARASAS